MISFIPQATGATAVSLWICDTGLMNECKNAPSSRYCSYAESFSWKRTPGIEMILVFPNPILKQLFMNQIGVPVHALLRKLSLAKCSMRSANSDISGASTLGKIKHHPCSSQIALGKTICRRTGSRQDQWHRPWSLLAAHVRLQPR